MRGRTGTRPPACRRRPAGRLNSCSELVSDLLTVHGDAKPFAGTYEVVCVSRVVAEVDLDPVNAAAEPVALGPVVVADRGGGVGADVEGLVAGKDHGDGGLDPSLP